jgi:hypothetical protein
MVPKKAILKVIHDHRTTRVSDISKILNVPFEDVAEVILQTTTTEISDALKAELK